MLKTLEQLRYNSYQFVAINNANNDQKQLTL